ncbi:MAG: alpha/beta hydrolase [Oscillatoriales cyanobacterium]|nr:MAG: alpha/beta hydrolase [Oscillatoriales cyanobacterium]TAH20878.1 MAG: alpha/beta hydrolase [Oscillatoriales cyanobacterium]
MTENQELTVKKSPIPHYRLPITDYPLPITHYRLPITDYPLPITPFSITHSHFRFYF